ncbi:MAG: DUF882 domain-containing protein [Polyangiales bacterium]
MFAKWRRAVAALLLSLAPALAVATFPAGSADAAPEAKPHVVAKGETLDQVAKKYGVTVKALVSANKLKDPSAVKPGTKLVIPKSTTGKTAAKANTYEKKPEHKGRVTLIRFGTKETQVVQVLNKKGKLVPGVLPRFARMMRFGPLNIEHKIDPRLVTLIAQVSDHFGGRPIEIISGFRPKTATQYTPHSNHNVGKAMDMRIAGVPNEVLRDYCRTFKQTGVGYYPNSLFVHFDVRKTSTFWIDLSKPGEAPKYVGKPTDIDEGLDDTSIENIDLTEGAGSSSVAPSPSVAPPTPSLSATVAPTAKLPPAPSATLGK